MRSNPSRRTSFPRCRQGGFVVAIVLIPIVIAEFAALGWGAHRANEKDKAQSPVVASAPANSSDAVAPTLSAK